MTEQEQLAYCEFKKVPLFKGDLGGSNAIVQQQLTRILTLVELSNSRLDKLDQDIQATNRRIEEEAKASGQRLQDEVKRWDDRFFQLIKEQGQTARTIIIAAASVVVLSPVLGSAVELVGRFFSQ